MLRGDPVGAVSTLKHDVTGDIIVAGSLQLARTLLENHLVDELRLMLYPMVLGEGRRLLEDLDDKSAMRLVANRTVAGDLVLLTYEPEHDDA